MILLTSLLLVALSVGVHYEALQIVGRVVDELAVPHRSRVALGILIAFGAHSLEAVLFAVGWMALLRQGLAELSVATPEFSTVMYFSFSTYTSLGYGDIVPLGPARILAGIEALLGLVMIAWTASFTYLEMQANWGSDSD